MKPKRKREKAWYVNGYVWSLEIWGFDNNSMLKMNLKQAKEEWRRESSSNYAIYKLVRVK